MTKTLTLEGDVTAVDTLTRLTTQGSVAAPSLVTPAGISKIDKIYAAAASDGAAAGSASFFLRLGGSAIQNGEQTVMIIAAGISTVQLGSDSAPQQPTPSIMEAVDIACNPSDTIDVAAEMAGQDLGTARVVVTLYFA